MNFSTLRYISKKLSVTQKKQKFLSFVRIIALLSVMLGSIALIVSLSVLEGFEEMLKEKTINFTSHINIEDFRKKPIDEYEGLCRILTNRFKEIKSIAPSVKREGLIRSGATVDGVLIRGFELQYDINGMANKLVKGSLPNPQNKEILIGERLANKLDIEIGSQIVLYAMSYDDSYNLAYPDIDKFTVSGFYQTGMAKYDDIIVYIPLDIAYSFFKMATDQASSIDVLLHKIEDVQNVSMQINEYLGYPYYSYTVFELHSSIFAWIELQKAPIPIVLGLISIVAVLNIITVLLITIVEKTHTIGILRALGMSRRKIVLIFVLQGAGIGLVGTFIGSGIALAFALIQQNFGIISLKGDIYFLDTLPIHIKFWHYQVVIGASLLLSILATFLPAIAATKITPIRAIRFK